MKSQGLILAGLASILIHAGAIVVIGAPAGSAIRGVATPQALDVQLPMIVGSSDSPQMGPASIETPLLPMTVNKNSQAPLPETFGQGTAQLLPEVVQEKQSHQQSVNKSGIKTEASDDSMVATELKLPTSYRGENELDIPPKALTVLLPEFPDNASAVNVRGKVVLMVFVSSGGAVDDVRIVEATPPGYFEASAIAAVKNVQFSAGQKSGQAVSSKIELSINYGLTL